jgi:hypothetical protein
MCKVPFLHINYKRLRGKKQAKMENLSPSERALLIFKHYYSCIHSRDTERGKKNSITDCTEMEAQIDMMQKYISQLETSVNLHRTKNDVLPLHIERLNKEKEHLLAVIKQKTLEILDLKDQVFKDTQEIAIIKVSSSKIY